MPTKQSKTDRLSQRGTAVKFFLKPPDLPEALKRLPGLREACEKYDRDMEAFWKTLGSGSSSAAGSVVIGGSAGGTTIVERPGAPGDPGEPGKDGEDGGKRMEDVRSLASGELPTTEMTVHSVPAGKTTIARVRVVNTNGTAESFTIKVKRSGEMARVISANDQDIPANEKALTDEINLTPGDKILAVGSTTGLDYFIDGWEGEVD